MEESYELYELRLALELYIVEQLAEKGMDGPNWQELYNRWHSYLTESLQIGENTSIQDEDFHESLAKALGNTAIYQKVKEVNERLHFIRMNDITTTERWRLTCEQHLKILEMINKRDCEGARKSMKINIEEGRSNADRAIKEALSNAYLKTKGHR
jgi:DNA-binding GntR family transcriptional regulator